MKGVRMLVGNFELTPKGRRSGRGPSFVWPLKEIMLIHRQYIYFYIFSRTTLNETFTAKYDGVLPRTLSVRRKSEIYTPKGDDEHPHPFHTRSAPPLTSAAGPPPPPGTTINKRFFSQSKRRRRLKYTRSLLGSCLCIFFQSYSSDSRRLSF